jgi:predicted secreted acid phosphatase
MDVIVDIDGTVADLTHRRHWVTSKPKNYAAFKAAAHLDTPIVPVIEAVKALNEAGHTIIFVSGREGTPEHRKVTVDWLVEQGFSGILVRPHSLFMRKAGDYRADDVIKEEILDEILMLGFRPSIAFDDRRRVIEMWKRRGILVLAINGGADF